MEAHKRQRVLDLLCTGTPAKEIAAIVGVSLSTVYDIKAKGHPERKVGSGGHNKIRSQPFQEALEAKIKANPTSSTRNLAKELGVGKTTIKRAVNDLGLKSYVRRHRQLLTEKNKEDRVTKCKKIINWLKHHPSTVLIFSDKKMWTVDQSRNRQNDRYLASSPDQVPPINRTKHPQGAMMLGVVASNGKAMPPYWFPAGLRVGAKEYLEVLQTVVKPWVDENFPGENVCWQQDSAPGHKAKVVQKWCLENFQHFWDMSFWPPQSPDANPLDYGIWGTLDTRACATPHHSVANLKASVELEWDNMGEDFIRKTCKVFRARLEKIVAVGGGHIEK